MESILWPLLRRLTQVRELGQDKAGRVRGGAYWVVPHIPCPPRWLRVPGDAQGSGTRQYGQP